MRKKVITIRKSVNKFLIKQLKKISGLKNNIMNNNRLPSSMCKYPKTESIGQSTFRANPDLSAIDRYLREFFPSLHNNDDEFSSVETSTKPSASSHADFSSSTSNSLVTPSSATDDAETAVQVVTYSTDPYNDFKRSMKSMLEVYQADNSEPNQEFLEELLLVYFDQNDKCMHKHVVRAFSDITREICQSGLRHDLGKATV